MLPREITRPDLGLRHGPPPGLHGKRCTHKGMQAHPKPNTTSNTSNTNTAHTKREIIMLPPEDYTAEPGATTWSSSGIAWHRHAQNTIDTLLTKHGLIMLPRRITRPDLGLRHGPPPRRQCESHQDWLQNNPRKHAEVFPLQQNVQTNGHKC